MEDTIHERIIGQNTQLFQFQSDSKSTSRFTKSNRPIASFIFAGPTGLEKQN
jgi:ATP-dependent Clp protease ATP-binding subunit ClpA